ncbi:uncharacterized protein L201_007600 [Kwoniella dendrophila CBS 6074]|uniref:RRM domain-containing protein n=1 Tax=Kwoniella dendrophila CBS 6074 TaxID=1295534 RepID=A0AAX4K4J1_9TREE
MSSNTNNDTPLPSPLPRSSPTSSDKRPASDGVDDEVKNEDDTPKVPNNELRIYGLNPAVTAENLINFFSSTTRVLGVLLHPQSTSTTTLQWAQLWVGSQAEVERCLELKQHLAPSGITMSKAPSTTAPPTNHGLLTPEISSTNLAIDIRAPPTPPSLSKSLRPDISGLGYRHIDPQGPLPRNLYVMGLPLDLTQMQFKTLFSQYGMVEHSTLLSQLDGMGRRRGFILMSTHREATEAMHNMNGTWLEGIKIDVSWALVQRDSKNFGSIIHPPSQPSRRELSEDCAVLVENLDPIYFPNAGAVREIFSTFGPVVRVTIVSVTPFQAVVNFEHEVSATALLNANGLSLGGRPVHTRRYARPSLGDSTNNSSNRQMSSPIRLTFDPFGSEIGDQLSRLQFPGSSDSSMSTSLNANSAPFIPIPYHNARWLSSDNRGRYPSQSDNTIDRYGESPDSTALSNCNSESTVNSSSDNMNSRNISVKRVNENTNMTVGQNAKAWPLPSEAVATSSKSRWTSAPR